jgi:pimeloyl-ACP methyl ester carboxylesterase
MSTFILVHGAWHDSRCWQQLAPLLRQAGHTVLTPDLPGHGQSSLPPARSTLKAYVQHVQNVVESCDEPVQLLGHSMAGVVITEVASKIPARIAQLIYLCAYIPQPGESVFSLIARLRGHEPLTPIELAMSLSDDKRFAVVEPEQIIPLFYQRTAPELAQQAVSRWQVQSSLPLAAQAGYSVEALVNVKKSYISCAYDKVLPLHHQRRLQDEWELQDCTELGTDHSPFTSAANETAVALQNSSAITTEK